MTFRKLFPVAAAFALAAGFVQSANAVVLYDSLSNPRYDSTDPGHVGSPYYFNVGIATDILWDDVPVDVGLVNSSVNVQQVQFGIIRRPNAPATTIDAYWAPMVADAGANRGGTNPNADPYDGTDEDPGTPVHIGQISLPANGASLSMAPITFGDGANTLFATGLLNLHYSPTVGYFMLGLKFSNPSEDNGWTIASGVNNLDVVWDDFQDGVPSSISEFTFGLDEGGVEILGTQAIRVVGTVPEPGSLALLGLGGLALVRRRRA